MRSSFFVTVIVCVFFAACNSGSDTTTVSTNKDSASVNDSLVVTASENELLITNESFGKINPKTDFEQLQKLYGEKNITDEIEYGAEGIDSFKVTRIYSGTPKEITVGWKEKKFHKEISYVECIATGSPYQTTDSLMINTTLDKLVKANGNKITFSGTGWDYGGRILSYNKGKLEDTPIYFQLTDMEGMSEKLMGDQELNTDMPLVKANYKKLVISKISVTFP